MSVVGKWMVFVLGTAGLVYVSRDSLLVGRSRFRPHGFYRFLAWEAILALGLLNLDVWFHDPFTWHQIISWCLLMASAFLVIYGAILLMQLGRQDPARDDVPLVSIEKTTTLVTVGIYRYIRHPMYSSLLFLAWGVFFKAPSWIGSLLAMAATLALVVTARVEEAEDIRFFGAAYEEYMKRTKRFIPFLF
jgi:protein-S-isoprenylcysteine O-methyltransferase Ste14